MSTKELQRELAAPVTVQIGEHIYVLSFPISAVIAYKQKTGDSLFKLENWQKMNPAEDPERFLTGLWAGLSASHPELTIEELGRKIDFGNISQVEKSLVAALKSYFPEPKTESTGDQSPNTEPAAIPA